MRDIAADAPYGNKLLVKDHPEWKGDPAKGLSTLSLSNRSLFINLLFKRQREGHSAASDDSASDDSSILLLLKCNYWPQQTVELSFSK